MTDWQTVHDAYPVNGEMIWLNNCGTTPAGDHIVSAMNRFLNGYAEKGILTEAAGFADVKARIKGILGDLINAEPDEIALIHHTAEGMNYISHGLDLNEGDEIILLENEYPSNVYPWRHLEKQGVRIRVAEMADSPAAFLTNLEREITDKTRLAALSSVHWCTGMPLPVEAAGRLLSEKGITFVLDGAQGVGMRPLDMKAAKIDFMALSAWKWLMGPLGMGVLYVAKEKLESLDPIFIGTESVVDDEQYLPYKDQLKPSADRFTISTPNFNDWVYLLASLEFLNEIGFDRVRERIYELADRLKAGLKSVGFSVMADAFPEEKTGIVVCEKPGTDAKTILAHLKKNKIFAAERLGRVRLSPHIYLLPEQIDRTIEVLKAV